MSRQDRRPLSQVPEDSVNSYMRPSTQQQSFTLPSSPYNPTDPDIFDTFAYFPSDAGPQLDDPNEAYYHPTDVQDVDNTGSEYPYLSSMQFPEMPLHTPVPPPAQPFFLLPDPSPEHEALPRSPDPPTAWDLDLNAILNATDLFAPLFPNTTESSNISVPHTPATAVAPHMLALDMPQLCSEAPSPGQRAPESHRRSRVPCVQPGTSGFVPSDPDDISPHEKKRLYVESLEQHIQFLHQLFASMNVQPVPLERVSSYRGLTTRSMRTILLTLHRSANAIHAQTITEANRMMGLRDALFQVQAANYAWQTYESDTALSPASDSAGTSESTCVASDPEVEFSKYFADPSVGGFEAQLTSTTEI
ncbi:hypothetical protein B0H17DRAFT_1192645 [Mycena rosella]|uniref:Uncharacterized protein n=1 Tax=Mycena rosella TaxID=1033263 RepID=A0AAD7GVA3_MYCRO|nr:hypothetical protein B0H17DRAFT_1192645 [Mycena rosella]